MADDGTTNVPIPIHGFDFVQHRASIFLTGAALGGLAGAVAGVILSLPARNLAGDLAEQASRRFKRDDPDVLRFELLSQ